MIPLCHQIALEVVEVDFEPDAANSVLQIQARAVTDARTGVEMEALVAVSAAALTIYDMAKADRSRDGNRRNPAGREKRRPAGVTPAPSILVCELARSVVALVVATY